MNEIELRQGDAIAEMAALPSESVKLVIADPPYNLGKDYGNSNDAMGHAEYLEFTKAWTREMHRILHPRGTVYAFMGFRFISYLYSVLERDLGMQFNSWITWHYTQGMGKTKGFSPRHDDILMFTKSNEFDFYLDAVRVPQKFYRQRNNMRGANPGDVWLFSHVHYSHPNRQEHPTQKPEGLIERMVLASSLESDTVLDPFVGSGTTPRVCQQLKRKCIGIEANPEYIRMSEARLACAFDGFDSIDPRVGRVPFDLRKKEIREEYLANHKRWFLKNHQNAEEKFESSVAELYDSNGRESKAISMQELEFGF